MSEIYLMTCRVCGRRFKRHAFMVYRGVDDVCVKCNEEIPFDGEKEETDTLNSLPLESRLSIKKFYKGDNGK